jgi:hypothetical protein
MKLTKELLRRLEESQRISLTPEQRLIMLYWYGHEPRHGWDEDDFALGIREVMRYYPDHRPKRNAYMDIPPQLRKERRAFLKSEAAAYLKANDMTPAERQDLLAWIKSGESVRDNPWLMTDEDGVPMDYLSAMRVAEDLRMQRLGS